MEDGIDGENVFYWSGEGEIDFVIKEGTAVTQLWQVVAGGLDDKNVLARELKAIQEAKKIFPKAVPFIVTKNPSIIRQKLPYKVIPLATLTLSG